MASAKIVITDDDDIKEYMKNSGDCEVCCDTKLSLIKCPYCLYAACESCYQKVILTRVTKPSCISCKKQFNDDFFFANFSDSFIKKKYKKHREDILFKMEEALLPETQPHVERIKRRDDLKRQSDDIENQIKELKEKQKKIRMKIAQTYDEVSEEKESSASVVCPCPVNDCRGFLNEKYVCGICGVKACRSCREVKKDKDHTCDPDIVKTVEELKKNCRNCPNCMISIYKISGCNQMFCVKCKVAFDWVTGKIETGLIHNPHYFEWMRENGGIPRNPHERECGGLPNANFLYDVKNSIVLKKIMIDNRDAHLCLSEMYRKAVHTQEVVLPGLPTIMDNNSNLDLRIDYLMKKIEKEDFMKKLVKREQDKTKMIEYRQIVEMYYNVVKDLFVKLIEDLSFDYPVSDIENIVKKFVADEQKIKGYSNESIDSVKKKYGSRSIHYM